MLFKDTVEVIAGKSVFISDFRHRVIEVFLHVQAPRFVPVGLGDIGDVVLLHFGYLMLPDEVADELEQLLGYPAADIPRISAKDGTNVEEVLAEGTEGSLRL